MTKSEKIKWGVLAVVAIIIIALLISVLRGTRQRDDTVFRELIKAKDETILSEKAHRESLEKQAEERHVTDSLLTIAIENNKPKYITNDKKFNDIPAVVRDLTKDELRRSAIDY